MIARIGENLPTSHGTVLVLGGDGFCGWPTSLHLSNIGYEVVIVDNLSRREIDASLQVESLTPIASIEERLTAWKQITGKEIRFFNLTLGQDYNDLVDLIAGVQPDTIVHFAEQRSAPFSMKSPLQKRSTIQNNICATHDILCAIAHSGLDIHLVHLGSIGVYGYATAGFELPEGYLPVFRQTTTGLKYAEILYPPDPGSIYHLTKANDQLLFQFYAKNDELRITDLHQGIVWGTQTPETALDERLINRFDYDGDYGTVLNRFLMQAALEHPLTVYGTGGQTRAFIHIRDTVRCIELAIKNPPRRGERVKILNQATETYRLINLAKLIANITGTPYELVENPRLEPAENELEISNQQLLTLGLKPTRLQDDLLTEVSDIARKYAFRCNRRKILSATKWQSHMGSTDQLCVAQMPLELPVSHPSTAA